MVILERVPMTRVNKVHIEKHSYDGYCVGIGIEYPEIVVSGKTDKDLQNKFLKLLPAHLEMLAKFPEYVEQQQKESKGKEVVVLDVDTKGLAK